MRMLGLGALVLGIGGALLAAGCYDYQDNCTYTLECVPTGSSGSGGTDGGVPTSCDPTQTTHAVADGCGVFVSPNGSDSNTGSQALPLKTLGKALAIGKTIYACAGTKPYTEAVTVAKPATLFGGLDCSTWVFSQESPTQLTAAAGAVPLTVSTKAGGTAVYDFAITAADATEAGGSSIAIVDDQAALTLDNVEVVAGTGAAGTAGAMPPAQVMTPMSANGVAGGGDATCNITTGVFGGAGGTNSCTGVDTSGGKGGDGLSSSAVGDPGAGGNPMMMPSNGGAGQSTTACTDGQPGAAGAPGMSGTGAKGIGSITNVGYLPPVAAVGDAGGPGQGGGGGGGAHQCTNPQFAGPSGGGGGAGGCPGAAGVVGTSGGSSIGIIALNATLTLTSTSITTHVGGAGGVGGDGQTGQAGGQQGLGGGATACAGGAGGQGGNGGPGGSGAGGHSVAIAILGGMLPVLTSANIMHGVGGAGGPANSMDTTMQTQGADGVGCQTLDFTDPTSPTACVM
jgi:hypothetical protein